MDRLDPTSITFLRQNRFQSRVIQHIWRPQTGKKNTTEIRKPPRKCLPWHQYLYRLQLHFLPRCPTWQLHGSPRSEPTLDVFFIQEKKHVKSIWGRGAEISSMFWQIQRSLQLGYIQLKVQSVLSRFLQLAFPHSLEHTVYRRIKWYGKITEFSRRFQHLLTLKSHNPSQFDSFHHDS